MASRRSGVPRGATKRESPGHASLQNRGWSCPAATYHCYQPPNQNWDPESNESLHDDLASHCSHGRTRNPRCDKGDQEHARCPDAE